MDNLTIRRIEKATCKDFLAKYHYLSKQGFAFRSGYNYGLYKEDKLIGVCIFHTVSALETVKGCFGLTDQSGFWELGRLAMDEQEKKKNYTSWFLAHCMKDLRKQTKVRAIITYADSAYHHGFIYQACNFRYYGLTAPKSDFWVKLPDGTYKKQSRGKIVGKDGEWRKRTRKHRYMIIFDKHLRTNWQEECYPKGDNSEY